MFYLFVATLMDTHNKEWADKMEQVGLTPSHTGKEGGNKTGQQMDDYPTPDGVFLKVFNVMPKDLLLPFKSSEMIAGVSFVGGAMADEGEQEAKPKRPKNKVKYTCSCGYNVWGKPDLNIICGECKEQFEVV